MLRGDFYAMFVCVLTAEFADLFDGLAARLLKVHHPIGESLDSHADMVTFGVLPGIGMYLMLAWAGMPEWLSFSGFILSLVSCYRLARFDSEESEKTFFGLATPSTTAFTLGLLLTAHYDTMGLREYILQPIFLFSVIGIFSYLMLSNIPMFNLKFERLTWKGNELRITYIIVGVGQIFIFSWASLPIGISLYIIMSIFLTKRFY